MAVYDQTYLTYTGPLTSAWKRFLILPRYAYRAVFQSKLFIILFIISLVFPLLASIWIYMHHNAEAMAILNLGLRDLIPINWRFFYVITQFQSSFATLLTLMLAPTLVSKDVENNGLALYLSRPFSRLEYVLGKMSVVLILLSAVTWMPVLLLFVFQGYLAGMGWMIENLRLGMAIVVGSWIWILTLCLGSLALSAWIKRKITIQGIMIGFYFATAVFAQVINQLFETKWGYLFSLSEAMGSLWYGLFGQIERMDLPWWGSGFTISMFFALSLGLLSRKIRAYEIIN